MLPGAAEVHLWWSAVDPNANSQILSPHELGRANRFRFDEDRARFISAHVMLRSVLAGYTDIAPTDLVFDADRFEKPYLVKAPPLQFNLSHSGDLLAVAVSRDARVGVDVERFRSMQDMFRMLRMIASPGEQHTFAMLPETERMRAFFSLWTRKEAVVKALGTGLSRSLQQIEVPLAQDIPPTLLAIDGDPWSLFSFEVMEGYAGALVVSGDLCSIVPVVRAWRRGGALSGG